MQKILTVNKDTLEKTTKCNKNLSCLSGEREDLCKVGVSMSSRNVVVRCVDNEQSCKYWASFGGSEGACLCPTRIELYQRYGI
jgi:hypothetical protein